MPHIAGKFEEIIKDLDTPAVAALGTKPATVY